MAGRRGSLDFRPPLVKFTSMPGPVAASVLRDSVERLDGAVPAEPDRCPNNHGLPAPTLREHKRYSGVLQHGHKEHSWSGALRPGKPGNAPVCKELRRRLKEPRMAGQSLVASL